jgi:hypothetical protein
MRLAQEMIQNRVSLAQWKRAEAIAFRQVLTQEWAMQPLSQHKIFALLAMLLVGVAVVAAIACQGHAAVSGHSHAAPAGHQHGGAWEGAACLVAVLPISILLIVPAAFWFYATLVELPNNAPHFRLFHPPRHTACAFFSTAP